MLLCVSSCFSSKETKKLASHLITIRSDDGDYYKAFSYDDTCTTFCINLCGVSSTLHDSSKIACLWNQEFFSILLAVVLWQVFNLLHKFLFLKCQKKVIKMVKFKCFSCYNNNS